MMRETESGVEVDLACLIDRIEHDAGQFGLPRQAVTRLREELAQRKRAEQALRESEARLRAIVDAAVDGIITIDEQGIIESVNSAVQCIFGYAPEELVGRNISVLMPEPHRSAHDAYIANYLRTGQRKIIGIGREALGQRKDGTIFPIDLAVSELRIEGHRLFTGIVRDITSRKQFEADLLAAKEAAEAANHAKDHFLAMLSHELRTPLTPVLAAITYIEATAELPTDLHKEIASVRRNVEMEARLIDDLLDLTRISRGKLELTPELVDTHVLLRQVVDICECDTRKKALEIRLGLHAQRRHIMGDPARMQQVFWNLIQNAVKFTPEGGHIAIRTRNRPGDDSILLVEIIDTGIGIETEAMSRIFNAFEQADRDTTRKYGGLGLGLAITKALIEMHGGTLDAFSDGLGKGSTFTACLPTVLQPAHSASPGRGRPADPAANRPGLRILLIEDHEDTLRVMSMLLDRCGHTVLKAQSSAEAMHIAASETFDLVVSDLRLPDGSGLDIMRAIRDRCQTPGIAISGFGMEDDIRRSREAGFHLHLTKPINFQTLQDAIERIAT